MAAVALAGQSSLVGPDRIRLLDTGKLITTSIFFSLSGRPKRAGLAGASSCQNTEAPDSSTDQPSDRLCHCVSGYFFSMSIFNLAS